MVEINGISHDSIVNNNCFIISINSVYIRYHQCKIARICRNHNRRCHQNLIYTDLHEHDVSNVVKASVCHKIETGLKAALSQ